MRGIGKGLRRLATSIVAAVLLFATPSGHGELSATVELAGKLFQVELATTPEQRRRGLMHRYHLPADRGMLFVYETPQPVHFWNKNVPIHLDYLFFDRDRKLLRVDANVPPCLSGPCPKYETDALVKYVLELAGGTVEAVGIAVGMELKIH